MTTDPIPADEGAVVTGVLGKKESGNSPRSSASDIIRGGGGGGLLGLGRRWLPLGVSLGLSQGPYTRAAPLPVDLYFTSQQLLAFERQTS